MQKASANLRRLPVFQQGSSMTPVFGVRSRQLPLSLKALLTIRGGQPIAILIKKISESRDWP